MNKLLVALLLFPLSTLAGECQKDGIGGVICRNGQTYTPNKVGGYVGNNGVTITQTGKDQWMDNQGNIIYKDATGVYHLPGEKTCVKTAVGYMMCQ